MKKLISLTLLLIALIVPQSGKAFEVPFNTNGFYYNGSASCNILENAKFHGAKASYSAGYMLSSAIGYRFADCLRAEAEFAYRNNHVKRLKFDDQSQRAGGYQESFSGLVNAYYDLPLCWTLRPYVGAGIGYGYATLKLRHNDEREKSHRDGFAWQAIGGLSYALSYNVDLALEYRFFKNENLSHFQNHNVGASLKYFF